MLAVIKPPIINANSGINNVLDVLPYGIAGLASILAFGIGFYLGAKLFFESRLLNTLSATIRSKTEHHG